jgi:hypothetical protein
MIPIEKAPEAILLFLECGCAAERVQLHPTGQAVLVRIVERCETHRAEPERFRAIVSGELVSPYVRTPATLDARCRPRL